MKKLFLSAVVAAALAGSAFTVAIAASPEAPGMHHMADMGLIMDAKLAGMKTALKLTSEQEKLWPVFETAVRDGARMRMETMGAMREHMKGEQPASPIAMMSEMSEHMAKMSEALKKVADAAKPLYDSLNEEQKSHFGPLLHMLREGEMHPGGGMMHGPMMMDH